MAVKIRCPFCQEVLYIEKEEFDTKTACPRCNRSFVWSKVLKESVELHCPFCKEKLLVKKKEMSQNMDCRRCRKSFVPVMTPEGIWIREMEKKRRYEKIKKRLKEREEQKRREEEAKLARMKEPSYACVECGVSISEMDVREGRALKEGGKVYCILHIPKLRKCPACGWDTVSRFAASCPRCNEPMVTPTVDETLRRIEKALLKIHEELKRWQRIMAER